MELNEFKDIIKDELEEKGLGLCDECYAIHEISRGENFYWFEDEEKWLCEDCENKRIRSVKK